MKMRTEITLLYDICSLHVITSSVIFYYSTNARKYVIYLLTRTSFPSYLDENCNNISISCNPVSPPCQPKSTCVSSVLSVAISPTPTSITKKQEESSSNYFTEKLISLNCPTQTCNCTVPTRHNKIQSTATMKSQTKLFSNNALLINSSRAVKVSSFSLLCNKTIPACTPAGRINRH